MKGKVPVAETESVVVIGSIAIDEIETPHGRHGEVFGGSASHFACAARFFSGVSVVGCVGKDMPADFRTSLEENGIDLSDVKELDGTTFRWHGRYNEDMSVAETLSLDFGVMADFEPELSGNNVLSPWVFLANAAPDLQLRMIEKVCDGAFIVCDTIRHWIESDGDAFRKVAGKSSGLILNDEEMRLLTGKTGLIDGADVVLQWGPEFVVVKKGEHGALLVCGDGVFPMPGYPVRSVVDPTGAGDSFAGGFMGTVCSAGATDSGTLRKALAAGIVISSFNVEGLGPEATLAATKDDVMARLDDYRRLLSV